MRISLTTLGIAAIAIAVAGCGSQRTSAQHTPTAPDPATTSRAPVASAAPVPAEQGLVRPVARLRTIAIPEVCQLNAPATGLQASVDAGHVPWRANATQVVLTCFQGALGRAGWAVHRVDQRTFRVTERSSGIDARVGVAQPARRGSGGIWNVTSIMSGRALGPPPACREDVTGLQEAVEAGHQPWRGDPLAVAQLCMIEAFGWRYPSGDDAFHGRLSGPLTVDLVEPGTGAEATVWLTRPSWHGHPGPVLMVNRVDLHIGQD